MRVRRRGSSWTMGLDIEIEPRAWPNRCSERRRAIASRLDSQPLQAYPVRREKLGGLNRRQRREQRRNRSSVSSVTSCWIRKIGRIARVTADFFSCVSRAPRLRSGRSERFFTPQMHADRRRFFSCVSRADSMRYYPGTATGRSQPCFCRERRIGDF